MRYAVELLVALLTIASYFGVVFVFTLCLRSSTPPLIQWAVGITGICWLVFANRIVNRLLEHMEK